MSRISMLLPRTPPAVSPLLLVLAVSLPAGGARAADENSDSIPADFPRFIVPGQEAPLASLRRMYYLHYRHYLERSRPMPAVWDEWMTAPTLWPAVQSDGSCRRIRRQWAQGLSGRELDPEGYVASQQHASIAHQQGWPFPFWQQGGPGTWGWHFSLRGVPHNWDGSSARTQEGWLLDGARDLGIEGGAWNIELASSRASVTTPALEILPDQAPFLQLRWRAAGLEGAQPFIEWTAGPQSGFSPSRRMYLDPPTGGKAFAFSMIPVYKSPAWKGRVTRLRIAFDDLRPGARIGIQALFTQYDTRHNVNNADFVRGCCRYFHWTRDLSFLRGNIQRMRLAMLYSMKELGGLREKCILTPFPGHDGRSGIELRPGGKKRIHSGRGIGNNYWDILPFGHRDAYATIQYYDSLRRMARLEEEIDGHPAWDIPAGPLRVAPARLLRHAASVKERSGKLFWSPATGRFVAAIDRDGVPHDYGFTFLNCEAVCYDFAAKAQADSILAWLEGARLVDGDTSRGADIYHWRFGPRSTTRRNIDWYGFYWYAPESLPWGGQVQDGGAVLGFSYHDILARLKVRGPDDAWKRLREVIAWFDEVEAAGGYRAYYRDGRRGTLQGGGVCGGLGMDNEFYESILVPHIMLSGFLGFEPRADGFALDPRLPRGWPRLTVTRIRFHGLVLDITADARSATITSDGTASTPVLVYTSDGTRGKAVPLQTSGETAIPLVR